MATTEEFRSRPAPRAPGKRLNRAALYAVGVGAITVTAACSSGDSSTGSADAAAVEDAQDESTMIALYGAPADTGVADEDAAADAGEDGSSTVALYGAPAPVDAGDDGQTVAPLYGAAPADSGKT